MTPFQAVRLWARRAPIAERITAGIGGAVGVAVLAFLVVPATGSSNHVSTAAGSGNYSATGSGGAQGGANASSPGPAGATGAGTGGQSSAGAIGSGAATSGSSSGHPVTGSSGGTGGSTNSGPAAVGGPNSGNQPSSGAATCPNSSATGVSAKQIKVAVTITQIAGAAGNSTFNIASPQAQQTAYQAAIDSINSSGGVDCRQLEPEFFTVNPADSSDIHTKCLDIAQAGVFATMDTGGVAAIAGGADCFGQQHIPLFVGVAIPASLFSQYYPYVFGFDTVDHQDHDTVLGFQQRGVFSSPSFKKVGIFYRNCFPQLYSEEIGWLHQAGVSDSQITSYNMGCPAALGSPSDIEQAVLQFEQQGVSHVTIVNEQGDFATFTKIAQEQHFNPQYVLPDDQDLIADSYGSTAPDPNNLANALAISNNRDGENTTPGFVPTAGTAKCNAVMQPKGLAPVYGQPAAIGNACDSVWELVGAIKNAPALAQTALAAGLQRTGTFDYSYPQGPSDYGPSLNGENGWRVAQWNTGCACWRLLSSAFSTSFPNAPDPAYH